MGGYVPLPLGDRQERVSLTFPEVQHLVGTAEIGEMLRVTRQRVHQLTRRPDFPAPVAHLKMGKIWERQAVEQWLEENGRLIREGP